MGTLAWQPALSHPELLAEPVRVALAGVTQPAWVAAIDPSLADTGAFCAAYGVGLEDSANCVVVSGRRGEVTRFAAVLVLATDRADINGVVRRELDVRKLSFSATDVAVTATGMAYGGITPLGLPSSWPVLVDEAVAARPWVVIGSGVRASKIALPGQATAVLPHCRVLALTR